MKATYNNLLEYIDSLDIFDTHEHLEPSSIRENRKVDIFNVLFNQYVSNDLISAGMKVSDYNILIDQVTPLEVKWNAIAPHLDNVKNAGYYRVLGHVLRDLFGIEELEESTYREADARLKQHSTQGLYDRILYDRCQIRYCVWDRVSQYDEYDWKESYMRQAYRLDPFIIRKGRSALAQVEQAVGSELSSLDLLIAAMKDAAFKAKSRGCIAIKNALAYGRKLYFSEVEKGDADMLFMRIYAGEKLSEPESILLSDYIMHETVKTAMELELPIQIHAGLHAGNGNYITNSNPVHLANLFMKYPKVRFDVFHGGYPYGSELATLAKNFPNVYANQCWLHAISPVTARNYLSEWLDTVPLSKIFGFGGDYISVEQVYGHLKLAKENIARVLADKVEEGSMTLTYAHTAASRILYHNPARFYGFE